METTNPARQRTELARELKNELSKSKSATPSALRERRELCERTRAFVESQPTVAVQLALPIATLLETELDRSGDRAAESFGSRTLSNHCQQSLAAAIAAIDAEGLVEHLGDHSADFFRFVDILEAALDEPTRTAVTRDVLATLGSIGQHSGSVFAEIDCRLVATTIVRVLSAEDPDSDIFRLLAVFAIFSSDSFPDASEVRSAIEEAWLDTESELRPWARVIISTDVLPSTVLPSVDRSYSSCIEYLLEDRSKKERKVAAEVLRLLTDRGILNSRLVEDTRITRSVLRGIRSREESVAAEHRDLLVALSRRGMTDSHEMFKTLLSFVESMEMSFPKDPRSDVHTFDQLISSTDLLSESTIEYLVDEIKSSLDDASGHGYYALAQIVSIFQTRTSVETGGLVDGLLASGRDRIEAGDDVACTGLARAISDLTEREQLPQESAERFLDHVLQYLESHSVEVHNAATIVVPALLAQNLFDEARTRELCSALSRSLTSSDEHRRGNTLNIVPELIETGRIDSAVIERISETVEATLRRAVRELERDETASDSQGSSEDSRLVEDSVHSDAIRGFEALRSNGHLSEAEFERMYPLIVKSLRFSLFEAKKTAAQVVYSMETNEPRVELDEEVYALLRTLLLEGTLMQQRVAATIVLKGHCDADHSEAHELVARLVRETNADGSPVEDLFSPNADSLPYLLQAIRATMKRADENPIPRDALEKLLREILLAAPRAKVQLLAMDVFSNLNPTTNVRRSSSWTS